MPGSTNGLANAYVEVGKILDEPQSFGLGERVPEPLLETLIRLQQILKSEMTKEPTLSSDYLADELSQDADRPLLEKQKDLTE
jgi:hypothetical protein